MVAKVLGKTGAPIKARDIMYKAVFQTVLLYGSESWLVTDAMLTMLEGFCHRTTSLILGETSREGNGR